ncbi:MAG: type I-E CRISPR-associated protein Cse2/CasB [Neofamilia sp.]
MKGMPRKKEDVFSVTGKIVTQLSKILTTSSGKAILANLRNSIGRPLSETLDVWKIMFENLPESFLGTHGKMTSEEQAILTSLQLFALHQQGNSESVSMQGDEATRKNMGDSLSFLRIGENTLSTDRRFNAMITSSSYDELVHHLRQMVKLLKSRTSAKINYALLAQDLYWYLRGYEENMRLGWARDYYRYKGEEKNDK